MAHTPAWRKFKRMQDTNVAVASLIYASAVVHAFAVLPGSKGYIAQWTLLWPGLLMILAFAVPVGLPRLGGRLASYVWVSFQAGFGQNVISIATSLVVLGGAAALIYWQVSQAAQGGVTPAALFCAYGAGIGLQAAQAVLARKLENAPEVQAVIDL